MEVEKDESKMSEDENENDDDNDQKMDNKSVKSASNGTGQKEEETDVIASICLNILSIPYYTQRLTEYKLESVIKSFISDNIWNTVINEFESYCIDLYNSFIFINKNNINTSPKKKSKNKKIIDPQLWQKIIPSSLTVSKFVSYANNRKSIKIDNDTIMEENKEETNLDLMDIPDFDDYDDDSDDEEEFDEPRNRNVLQTFMNMTEEQNNDNALNVDQTENKSKDNANSSELYMNPNNKGPSLSRRKKRRNKRRRKRHKKSTNIINELPAIVWTVHNLLNLYCDKRKFEMNNYQNAKTFVSFLNISQITFKLLDFITPPQFGNHAAFPYGMNMNSYYIVIMFVSDLFVIVFYISVLYVMYRESGLSI